MLKLLLLAGLIWGTFMLFRKNKEVPGETADSALEMHRDPVCDAWVEEDTSFKVKYHDELHYFCSEECRQKFIADKKGDTQ